jgi:hypothetical protein
MLQRTKPFAIVRLVSSMSPLIWIQPAHIGGLFFCPEFPGAAYLERRPEKIKPAVPLCGGAGIVVLAPKAQNLRIDGELPFVW